MSLNEGLARLRAIRGGHRAVLTKYLNESEKLLATAEISEESLMRLEVLRQQIDGKQKTLNELDAKILNEIKIEDVEKEKAKAKPLTLKLPQQGKESNERRSNMRLHSIQILSKIVKIRMIMVRLLWRRRAQISRDYRNYNCHISRVT